MPHYTDPPKEAKVLSFGTASDRVQRFVNSARDKNLWIFDKTFKKWYSPDEFVDRFNYYPNDADELLKRCVEKDPLDAIADGQYKLAELTRRVFDYMRRNK